MQKMLAALLLFCVGIMIPASASAVRVCLLELGLSPAQEESTCCCSQETEQPDPCCLDLEELPNATAPQLPLELPAVVIVDVPPSLCPTPVVTELHRGFSPVSEPIRGPTSPAAYRAVLGIWRL